MVLKSSWNAMPTWGRPHGESQDMNLPIHVLISGSLSWLKAGLSGCWGHIVESVNLKDYKVLLLTRCRYLKHVLPVISSEWCQRLLRSAELSEQRSSRIRGELQELRNFNELDGTSSIPENICVVAPKVMIWTDTDWELMRHCGHTPGIKLSGHLRFLATMEAHYYVEFIDQR